MSGPAVGRLRGKTSAGRLRLWDALCAARFPAACARGVVDVGLGERADTTVELLESLGQPVLALEVHPTRVAWARERLRGRPIEVLEVDALLGAREGPRGGLLRCANVLRQYPVEAVAQAHSALCSWVEEGGIVLEGSTYCTNSWSVSGSETSTSGCSGCSYAFEIDHQVTSEECGSSSDFDWTLGWPYDYGGYDTVAVEYYGNWYPYGFLYSSSSSSAYWYQVSGSYEYGPYEYYFFLIGDYTIY
mgnify:CR=1 FL=1